MEGGLHDCTTQPRQLRRTPRLWGRICGRPRICSHLWQSRSTLVALWAACLHQRSEIQNALRLCKRADLTNLSDGLPDRHVCLLGMELGCELTEGDAWPLPPQPCGVIAGTRSLSWSNPTSWIVSMFRLLPGAMFHLHPRPLLETEGQLDGQAG